MVLLAASRAQPGRMLCLGRAEVSRRGPLTGPCCRRWAALINHIEQAAKGA